MARPHAILAEIQRVLKHQGTLYLSAPLVWELHEASQRLLPLHACWSRGSLLAEAGFAEIDVRPGRIASRPSPNCFATSVRSWGSAADGLDEHRRTAAATLFDLSEQVGELARLDSRWILPLGYEVTCTRP
ncbi:MAG: hypothetical protein M5T61_21275 [Acidimicrobiia bacterium]|nr:hypothetical protein [Acidimicrobiia bacterium]